jgi:hypothetical protein
LQEHRQRRRQLAGHRQHHRVGARRAARGELRAAPEGVQAAVADRAEVLSVVFGIVGIERHSTPERAQFDSPVAL